VSGDCCCRKLEASRVDCGDAVAEDDRQPVAPRHRRRVLRFMGGAASGAILAALPKCPACIAGYVALGTGLGISMTAAASIRIAIVAVCLAAIVGVMVDVCRMAGGRWHL
jgi:hypothetical protein